MGNLARRQANKKLELMNLDELWTRMREAFFETERTDEPLDVGEINRWQDGAKAFRDHWKACILGSCAVNEFNLVCRVREVVLRTRRPPGANPRQALEQLHPDELGDWRRAIEAGIEYFRECLKRH